MTRTIQFRAPMRDQALIVAILEVLARVHGSGYDLTKPRRSLTFTLTLSGPQEDAIFQDFQSIAEAAGWRATPTR